MRGGGERLGERFNPNTERDRFSKRFNLERERGTDKHEREVGEKEKERETKLL